VNFSQAEKNILLQVFKPAAWPHARSKKVSSSAADDTYDAKKDIGTWTALGGITIDFSMMMSAAVSLECIVISAAVYFGLGVLYFVLAKQVSIPDAILKLAEVISSTGYGSQPAGGETDYPYYDDREMEMIFHCFHSWVGMLLVWKPFDDTVKFIQESQVLMLRDSLDKLAGRRVTGDMKVARCNYWCGYLFKKFPQWYTYSKRSEIVCDQVACKKPSNCNADHSSDLANGLPWNPMIMNHTVAGLQALKGIELPGVRRELSILWAVPSSPSADPEEADELWRLQGWRIPAELRRDQPGVHEEVTKEGGCLKDVLTAYAYLSAQEDNRVLGGKEFVEDLIKAKELPQSTHPTMWRLANLMVLEKVNPGSDVSKLRETSRDIAKEVLSQKAGRVVVFVNWLLTLVMFFGLSTKDMLDAENHMNTISASLSRTLVLEGACVEWSEEDTLLLLGGCAGEEPDRTTSIVEGVGERASQHGQTPENITNCADKIPAVVDPTCKYWSHYGTDAYLGFYESFRHTNHAWNALYLTLITFSSMGYGDLMPMADWAKVFSGALIPFGTSLTGMLFDADGIVEEASGRPEDLSYASMLRYKLLDCLLEKS
jgi:hypothetical protein